MKDVSGSSAYSKITTTRKKSIIYQQSCSLSIPRELLARQIKTNEWRSARLHRTPNNDKQKNHENHKEETHPNSGSITTTLSANF
jgi:hypothetical protein